MTHGFLVFKPEEYFETFIEKTTLLSVKKPHPVN